MHLSRVDSTVLLIIAEFKSDLLSTKNFSPLSRLFDLLSRLGLSDLLINNAITKFSFHLKRNVQFLLGIRAQVPLGLE